MASFEADFVSHLRGDATLTELISDAAGNPRIFPLLVPKSETIPAITYTVVYGTPYNSLDGFTSGLSRYVVQVDCWASTAAMSRRVALAVRDRMNVVGASFHAVVTDYPLLEDYEPDTSRFRRALQVSCIHEEP